MPDNQSIHDEADALLPAGVHAAADDVIPSAAPNLREFYQAENDRRTFANDVNASNPLRVLLDQVRMASGGQPFVGPPEPRQPMLSPTFTGGTPAIPDRPPGVDLNRPKALGWSDLPLVGGTGALFNALDSTPAEQMYQEYNAPRVGGVGGFMTEAARFAGGMLDPGNMGLRVAAQGVAAGDNPVATTGKAALAILAAKFHIPIAGKAAESVARKLGQAILGESIVGKGATAIISELTGGAASGMTVNELMLVGDNAIDVAFGKKSVDEALTDAWQAQPQTLGIGAVGGAVSRIPNIAARAYTGARAGLEARREELMRQGVRVVDPNEPPPGTPAGPEPSPAPKGGPTAPRTKGATNAKPPEAQGQGQEGLLNPQTGGTATGAPVASPSPAPASQAGPVIPEQVARAIAANLYNQVRHIPDLDQRAAALAAALQEAGAANTPEEATALAMTVEELAGAAPQAPQEAPAPETVQPAPSGPVVESGTSQRPAVKVPGVGGIHAEADIRFPRPLPEGAKTLDQFKAGDRIKLGGLEYTVLGPGEDDEGSPAIMLRNEKTGEEGAWPDFNIGTIVRGNGQTGAPTSAPAPATEPTKFEPAIRKPVMPDFESQAPEVQDPKAMVSKSGRKLPPYPDKAITSERMAKSQLRAADQWIIEQAIAEAESIGDDFNATGFRSELDANGKLKQSLPPASRDAAFLYTFGREQVRFEHAGNKPSATTSKKGGTDEAQEGQGQEGLLNDQGEPGPSEKAAPDKPVGKPATWNRDRLDAVASDTPGATASIIEAMGPNDGNAVVQAVLDLINTLEVMSGGLDAVDTRSPSALQNMKQLRAFLTGTLGRLHTQLVAIQKQYKRANIDGTLVTARRLAGYLEVKPGESPHDKGRSTRYADATEALRSLDTKAMRKFYRQEATFGVGDSARRNDDEGDEPAPPGIEPIDVSLPQRRPAGADRPAPAPKPVEAANTDDPDELLAQVKELEAELGPGWDSPDLTRLYQRLGTALVPGVRLQDAEEVAKLYQGMSRGTVTLAEYTDFVADLRKSGKVARSSDSVQPDTSSLPSNPRYVAYLKTTASPNNPEYMSFIGQAKAIHNARLNQRDTQPTNHAELDKAVNDLADATAEALASDKAYQNAMTNTPDNAHLERARVLARVAGDLKLQATDALIAKSKPEPKPEPKAAEKPAEPAEPKQEAYRKGDRVIVSAERAGKTARHGTVTDINVVSFSSVLGGGPISRSIYYDVKLDTGRMVSTLTNEALSPEGDVPAPKLPPDIYSKDTESFRDPREVWHEYGRRLHTVSESEGAAERARKPEKKAEHLARARDYRKWGNESLRAFIQWVTTEDEHAEYRKQVAKDVAGWNAGNVEAAKKWLESTNNDGEPRLGGLANAVAAYRRQMFFTKADAFSVGNGVGYRVAGQVNRGFQIVAIDADNLMAQVRQVSDTGLTTSGGNTDRMADTWVQFGDLIPDHKYDGPRQSKTVSAAGAPSAPTDPIMQQESEVKARLYGGNITAAEFRAAYARFRENKPKLREALMAKTLAQLAPRGSGSATKAEVVTAIVDRVESKYQLGRSISYSMDEIMLGNKDRDAWVKVAEGKIGEIVDSLTDEDLATFAKEYAERRAAFEKSMSNPETLDEFQTFINRRGVEALTDEQRKKYEDLQAEHTLSTRQRQETARAGYVAKVDTGDAVMKVVKSYHTKRNEDIWIVTLDRRVSAETYSALNSAAKRLGGYYAKQWGESPAGFTFKTEEDANKFAQINQKSADRTEAVEQRVEDRRDNSAERLAERAEAIREAATEKLDADRKENTAKRAREADQARADARKALAKADTLERIASGIREGTIKFLKDVAHTTHLEALENILIYARMARIAAATPEMRASVNWDKLGNEPYGEADVKYAAYPWPSFHAGHLRDLVGVLKGKPGMSRIVASAERLIASTTAEKDWGTLANDKDVDAIEQLAKRGANTTEKYIAGQALDRLTTFKRTRAMNLHTDEEVRAALREYLSIREKPKEADPIAKMERDVLQQDIPDFFPTPSDIVERMVSEAGIEPGMLVLEPSAGRGDILAQLGNTGGVVHAAELNVSLRNILAARFPGVAMVGHDFMQLQPAPSSGDAPIFYDRVVMNPPFSNRQDVDHVRHAFSLLKPGGRVVAIVSAGSVNASAAERKVKDFVAWVEDQGGTIEMLPDGAFSEGPRATNIRTALVVVDKPGQAEPAPVADILLLPDMPTQYYDQVGEYAARGYQTSQNYATREEAIAAALKANAMSGGSPRIVVNKEGSSSWRLLNVYPSSHVLTDGEYQQIRDIIRDRGGLKMLDEGSVRTLIADAPESIRYYLARYIASQEVANGRVLGKVKTAAAEMLSSLNKPTGDTREEAPPEVVAEQAASGTNDALDVGVPGDGGTTAAAPNPATATPKHDHHTQSLNVGNGKTAADLNPKNEADARKIHNAYVAYLHDEDARLPLTDEDNAAVWAAWETLLVDAPAEMYAGDNNITALRVIKGKEKEMRALVEAASKAAKAKITPHPLPNIIPSVRSPLGKIGTRPSKIKNQAELAKRLEDFAAKETSRYAISGYLVRRTTLNKQPAAAVVVTDGRRLAEVVSTTIDAPEGLYPKGHPLGKPGTSIYSLAAGDVLIRRVPIGKRWARSMNGASYETTDYKPVVYRVTDVDTSKNGRTLHVEALGGVEGVEDSTPDGDMHDKAKKQAAAGTLGPIPAALKAADRKTQIDVSSGWGADWEVPGADMAGQFPPYEDMWPTRFEGQIDIDAGETLDALRQVAIMASEENIAAAVWRNTDGTLGFATRSEAGEAIANVKPGAEFILAVNPKFLAEAVEFPIGLGAKTVRFSWESGRSPMLVSYSDHGVQYRSLIMPVNLPDAIHSDDPGARMGAEEAGIERRTNEESAAIAAEEKAKEYDAVAERNRENARRPEWTEEKRRHLRELADDYARRANDERVKADEFRKQAAQAKKAKRDRRQGGFINLPTPKDLARAAGGAARVIGTAVNKLTKAAAAKAPAAWRALAGQSVPRTAAHSEDAANAIVRFAVSKTAAPYVARDMVAQVLGPKIHDEAFRVRLGAVLVEDRLKAIKQAALDRAAMATTPQEVKEALDEANNVKSLIGAPGNPLKTQQDYNDALADPDIVAAIEEHKNVVMPWANERFRYLQNDPAATYPTPGPDTGAFVNLKAIRPNQPPPGAGQTTRGRLTNPLKRKSGFAVHATGSADAYEIDYQKIIENTVERDYESEARNRMYDALKDANLAIEARPGQQFPVAGGLTSSTPEFDGKPGVQFEIMRKGATMGGHGAQTLIRKLYVHPDVAPEVRAALNVDARPDGLMAAINHALTTMQIIGVTDFAAHATNILRGVTANLHGGPWYVQAARATQIERPIEAVARIAKAGYDVFRDSPEVRRELAELAQIGAMRGESHHGWSSKALAVLDRAGRVALDRLYRQLVSEGYQDSEQSRREFNNQIGQYEARLRPAMFRWLKEAGLAPFVVAGTSFNRLGVRAMAGTTPLKANTWGAALAKWIARIGGFLVSSLLASAFVNWLTVGNIVGRPGTPFGAIDTGIDKGGKPVYVDPLSWSGVRRGLRVTGLNATAEGVRYDRRVGDTLDDALGDILMSGIHPWAGPAVETGNIALTGRDIRGVRVAPVVPPGNSQRLQNIKTAATHLNPMSETYHDEAPKSSGGEAIVSALTAPFIRATGIGTGRPPNDVARNRAEYNDFVDDLARRARRIPRDKRVQFINDELNKADPTEAARARRDLFKRREVMFSP